MTVVINKNDSKGYIEIKNNEIYIRRFKIKAAFNE